MRFQRMQRTFVVGSVSAIQESRGISTVGGVRSGGTVMNYWVG